MASHTGRYREAERDGPTEEDPDMSNPSRSFRLSDDDWNAVTAQAERDRVKPARAIALLARAYAARMILLPIVREELIIPEQEGGPPS